MSGSSATVEAARRVTPDALPAAIAALQADGFRVARIDCGTEDGLTADLADALNWQDNLGFTPQGLNLDALYDALHHEPNATRPRLALVWESFAALQARDPRRAAGIPEVIADRVRDLDDKRSKGTDLRLTALLV